MDKSCRGDAGNSTIDEWRLGVIYVALVASVNRPHVRFAPESDRIAAQQRNDAQGP
jgi:hypothetical protein